MRTFEYVCFEIASSGKQPVLFCQNGDKTDIKCVFYSYIKKLSITV